MRSSTSSSNERLPRGGWGRTWALTLLLVLGLLGGWEILWRLRGFEPEVQSDDELWILNLRKVPQATTVVLGTSRIRTALDPEALRSELGGTPAVGLALPGNSPIPVLEYLADSTRYAGILIVELMPMYAFEPRQGGARRTVGLLRRYARDRVSPARLSEDWLQVHVLRHLVFREPQLLPVRFASILSEGGTIRPSLDQTSVDGFTPKRFRRLVGTVPWDPREGFAGRDLRWLEGAGRPANDSEFAALSGRINRAADRIMDRGGTVVFLFMAGCGERARIEESRYPRAKYWDPLARQTRAIAIAAPDYPELSRFDCFDGSHLDAADTPAFSAALGRMIREARARR